MQEIVDFGSTMDNVFILHAKRLNRYIPKDDKFIYEPSTTILLTLDTRVIPKFMHVNLIRYKTDFYKRKPIQCYNCFNFGHTKNSCRSKGKCSHCGSAEHNIIIHCPNALKDKCCANCNQNHSPLDSIFPVKIRQNDICDIAFEKQISFPEARQLYYDSLKKPVKADFPSLKASTYAQVSF